MSGRDKEFMDTYDKQMLRSYFVSIFALVIERRRKEGGFTMSQLAERLGKHKSAISRWFNSPPNWTIETLSEVSGALDVDLIVEARDRKTGEVYRIGAAAASAPVVRTMGVVNSRSAVAALQGTGSGVRVTTSHDLTAFAA